MYSCADDKKEDSQNFSVLCCVPYDMELSYGVYFLFELRNVLSQYSITPLQTIVAHNHKHTQHISISYRCTQFGLGL